jgi:integrase
MGTITARRRKSGSTAYMAQISIQRDGKSVRENRTFDRKPAATAWINKREKELSEPGALAAAAASEPKAASSTLADAIKKYVADSRRAIGRTKGQVLAAVLSHGIAEMQCDRIESRHIVAYAEALGERMQPQTAANYLSHLASVFAIAGPAWGFPLNPQAMADALKVSKRLGLTAKSNERSRRPTLDELDSLMKHFAAIKKRRPSSNPMCALVAFAIYSTRRQEEITRIRWADLDEAHSRIMVRDMKNPGQTVGNDVLCHLPPEALRIILAQPRKAPEIFPYSAETISAAFTRACHFLGIVDLHFHDLRHDGVSRLFEQGWTIPQAASVSGHRSWSSLKRYSHLRQTGDKFAGWRWLDIVALPSPIKALP